jgi:hypothetical protein
MEYYLTHGLKTFSPKNQKHSAMIDLIKHYEYLIIIDRTGLDSFIGAIRYEVDFLNKKYPKTKEMKFRYANDVISVFVPGMNSDLDNHLFYLHVGKARGTYRFPEFIDDDGVLPSPEQTLSGKFKPGAGQYEQ